MRLNSHRPSTGRQCPHLASSTHSNWWRKAVLEDNPTPSSDVHLAQSCRLPEESVADFRSLRVTKFIGMRRNAHRASVVVLQGSGFDILRDRNSVRPPADAGARCRAAHRATDGVSPLRLPSLTPARYACPPGDRLDAHPRRAVLGTPRNSPNSLRLIGLCTSQMSRCAPHLQPASLASLEMV